MRCATLARPVVNSRQAPSGFPQEGDRPPGRRSRSPTRGKPRGWHPGRIWPSPRERTGLLGTRSVAATPARPLLGAGVSFKGSWPGRAEVGAGVFRGVPGAARPLFGVPFRTPLRCPGFAGASLRGGSIPGATSPSGGICWRRGLRCLTRAAADKLRPVPHGFQTVWTAAGFAPELRDVRPRGSVGGWSFSAQ